MPAPLFTFIEYIKYRFRAIGAHSLHSPFLFDLYNEVLKKKDLNTELALLELRRELADVTQTVSFNDPKTNVRKTKTVQELAKNVASGHEFSYLLIRLIDYLGYERILETGTSIGLNTLYLARSCAKNITTIEGSEEIAAIAQSNIDAYNLDHINIVIGNVKDVFSCALQKAQPELVFLDADHRSETIDFYLSTIRDSEVGVKCIIIHDIYWSPDMKNVWTKIIADPAYNLTIDIFQAGIIFPDYPMEKQHFTMKF